jgi:Vault protein inter-alpha-trypsin.
MEIHHANSDGFYCCLWHHFLLFAATCLSFDLWKRTEPSIAGITRAFTILGGLVSLLFVCTPLARGILVQSMLTDAKYGSASTKTKAISALRGIATAKDLQPSRNLINGFALASLLIPDRGLDSQSNVDQDAYFKITGKPYFANPNASALETESPNVGAKVPGLALSKSQITGSIDGTTLSSSVDWTLTVHNSSGSTAEARGEIQLPRSAAVSRVTLWMNGEPREAAFSSTSKTSEAYQSVVARQRDPLLVTMPAPDRVLIQCFPVLPNSKMKIRLGFKIPLQTSDGKSCSMQLPRFLSTNFTQDIRHRIKLFTADVPIQSIPGMITEKNNNGYLLHGIVKADESKNKRI